MRVCHRHTCVIDSELMDTVSNTRSSPEERLSLEYKSGRRRVIVLSEGEAIMPPSYFCTTSLAVLSLALLFPSFVVGAKSKF